MLRSLFAGISGLRVHQTMLDVTGNNIANANTIGYKSSSTIFQDTLSQMLTGASGSTPDRGGSNPIQIGLGVQLAAEQAAQAGPAMGVLRGDGTKHEIGPFAAHEVAVGLRQLHLRFQQRRARRYVDGRRGR